MLLALVFYLIFMLALGILSYYKINSYKDFVIAGAKQNTMSVSLSLLAGIVGSSATFGMVSLVSTHGFPAFWWLGTGAFFLMLQAILLTKPVRELNAYSLPHVARIVMGEKASLYISYIILFTWIGIIAAQFTALGQIISIMIDIQNPKIIIAIIAIFVIIYTLLGGQLSILKTDAYQFILLFSSMLLIFFLLYFTNYHYSNTFVPSSVISFDLLDWQTIHTNLSNKFELMNERFNSYDLLYLSLLAGLAFFVGPDIFSRNLSAKNAKIAQQSTFITAFLLIIFALIMTYIALWVNEFIVSHKETNLLIPLITDYLPLPIAILFSIGLISALISSADTCLMSTAIILSNDILKKRNIKYTRIFISVIGLIALSLALFQDDIISLLLGAYSVYVPGVVLPLSIAIYFYKKRPVNQSLLFFGMFCGSFLGLSSNLAKMPNLAIYGIIVSAFFGLMSIYIKKIPYIQYNSH